MYELAERPFVFFVNFETRGTDQNIKLRNLEIGSFQGGRQFDGTIDDVRVYDHTLTEAELEQLVSAIFVDDFESGDTAAWSSPVP